VEFRSISSTRCQYSQLLVARRQKPVSQVRYFNSKPAMLLNKQSAYRISQQRRKSAAVQSNQSRKLPLIPQQHGVSDLPTIPEHTTVCALHLQIYTLHELVVATQGGASTPTAQSDCDAGLQSRHLEVGAGLILIQCPPGFAFGWPMLQPARHCSGARLRGRRPVWVAAQLR
jgi:hypothetical protein